jgi:hypothetical protein
MKLQGRCTTHIARHLPSPDSGIEYRLGGFHSLLPSKQSNTCRYLLIVYRTNIVGIIGYLARKKQGFSAEISVIFDISANLQWAGPVCVIFTG